MSDMPSARQACTYSRSRCAMNSARARRAIGGHETTAIAAVMLMIEGRKIAISTTASTKDGIVRKKSVQRISTVSTAPAVVARDARRRSSPSSVAPRLGDKADQQRYARAMDAGRPGCRAPTRRCRAGSGRPAAARAGPSSRTDRPDRASGPRWPHATRLRRARPSPTTAARLRRKRRQKSAQPLICARSAGRAGRRSGRPPGWRSPRRSTEDMNRMPSSRLRSRCSSASKTRRPRPGQPNTVSTRIDPPSRWPICTPASVTTGSSALRAACTKPTRASDTPFARAVGDEVERIDLEHRRAHQARVDRDIEQAERHRRQHEVSRDVDGARGRAHLRVAIVIIPPEGRMRRRDREQHDQHEAEPELRRRVDDQRQRPRRAQSTQRPVTHRGDNPGEHADQQTARPIAVTISRRVAGTRSTIRSNTGRCCTCEKPRSKRQQATDVDEELLVERTIESERAPQLARRIRPRRRPIARR